MTNHYLKLLNNLEDYLAKNDYHVLISNINLDEPNLDIIQQRDLEGVIILDVDKNIFYDISIKFTVPILLVDSYIEDILFHKIIIDFPSFIEKAKKELDKKPTITLIPKLNNIEIMKKIKEEVEDVFFIDSYNELVDILNQNKDKNIIVAGEELGVIVSKYIPRQNISVICINDEEYLLNESINRVIINNKERAKKIGRLLLRYIAKDYEKKNLQ